MPTLYEKVGRRYRPVHDTAACNGLANGDWYIRVKNGGLSCCLLVDEADKRTALRDLASRMDLVELLVPILREASDARPTRPLTMAEERAWAKWTEIVGHGPELWLERPSLFGIAERVAEALVARVGQPSEKPSC